MNRFFALDIKGTLTKEDEHHLLRVLRATEGMQVELVLDGAPYLATIDSLKPLHFTIGEALINTESPLEIHLFQGYSKGDKMDFVFQKGTELGAQHFYPMMTENTDIRIDEKRKRKKEEHYRGVVEAAAKQAKRSRIPTIHETLTLKDALEIAKDMEIVFCYEKATEPIQAQKGKPLAIFIGPEGGFSDEEVDLFASYGAAPLSLGPRILRTETAGIVALTILQYTLGDLQ